MRPWQFWVTYVTFAGIARANLMLAANLVESTNAPRTGKRSTEEIEDQLLTMIFAGYETTAATLAFALYSKARNSDIKQTFHEELDGVLGEDLPDENTIGDLEYTRRIINETFRLYPPIHTIPRKTNADIEVGNYRISQESQVHLSVIQIHSLWRPLLPASITPDLTACW